MDEAARFTFNLAAVQQAGVRRVSVSEDVTEHLRF